MVAVLVRLVDGVMERILDGTKEQIIAILVGLMLAMAPETIVL